MKLIKTLFLGIAAVYAECQCENGTASTTADCVTSTQLASGSTVPPVTNVCQACNNGYYLNTDTLVCVQDPVCPNGQYIDVTTMPRVCADNVCTCQNGVGATGTSCSTNGDPFCGSCTSAALFDLTNGACNAKPGVAVATQTFAVTSALPTVTFVPAMSDQTSEIFRTTAATAQDNIFQAASANLPDRTGLLKDDVTILRLFDPSAAAANRRRKRSTGVGVDSTIKYTYDTVTYTKFEDISNVVESSLVNNLANTNNQQVTVGAGAASVSLNMAVIGAMMTYYFR